MTLGHLPLTIRAERVLKNAYLEASSRNQSVADNEHLLLAMLREKDGVVFEVLSSLNFDFDTVSELVDSAVMPGIQGGPLMHVIAGKAVAFQEALKPEYKDYCKQIISNADTLAQSMKDLGYDLISGGTDTHLILIDLSL